MRHFWLHSLVEFIFWIYLCSCSFSPQHIEECCGWLRQKLDELNKEQDHIVHQHQEQVRATVLYLHEE